MSKCDVCDGLCCYPIINNKGSHLYDIRCPECFGAGTTEDAAVPEAPTSTATRIKSMEEMREHVRQHWS